MPVVKRTPPIDCKGRFVLKAPWSASGSLIYVVKAIRKFNDIYELGEDVYENYYKDAGFASPAAALAAFNEDEAAGANIVTLMTDTQNLTELGPAARIIYVPDTYIESYPDMSDFKYSNIIISIDLGALPDYLSLDNLVLKLKEKVGDVIGVENVPTTIHKSPSSVAVSRTNHEISEAARLTAITERKTTYAMLLDEKAKGVQKDATIDSLIAILTANGLWPPVP